MYLETNRLSKDSFSKYNKAFFNSVSLNNGKPIAPASEALPLFQAKLCKHKFRNLLKC